MTDGYAIAVADGLVFSLADGAWERLAARDPAIARERLVDTLAAIGVQPSFGDGELSVVSGRAAELAALHDQLARIRAAAPIALAAGADTFARLACTDPWPRIYTTAVLDTPADSPVHVVHASDLAGHRAWARVGQLAQFELRVLVMFGAPLGRERWPFERPLGELRAIDLSASHLREIPASLADAAQLEAIELAGNPLDPRSLAVLASLPRLRYVGLRDTGLARRDVPALPADCELAI